MPILITGGLGFLGPVVAEEILKKDEGEKIVLLDVSPKKMPNFLEKHKNNIVVTEANITDFEKILDICKKFEVDRLIHLAAIADVDIAEKNPLRACEVNINGVYNMFEVSRRLKVKKVIFASSGAIYGKTKGPVSEDTPYNPADVYGATKAIDEIIGLQYVRSYGLDLIVTRLYFIYGPRMFFEPISPFGMVKNAVEGKPTVFEKGKEQLFDFTHVRDAARGVVLALLADSEKLDHRVFNISSGQAVRLEEIVEIIKKYIPEACIELGPGELGTQRGFPLNISRAKKELGYEPTVRLEDGIKETIGWLKKN